MTTTITSPNGEKHIIHFECNQCKKTLPCTSFFKANSYARGYDYSCKECIRERKNAWKRESWAKHKDRYNKEKKDYYKKYPEKQRANNLKSHYGITLEQYDEMYKKQGGICAICGWVPTNVGRYGKLCVDHSHVTNKLRGLLCHQCNLMIGIAKDKQDILLKGIEYLESHATL